MPAEAGRLVRRYYTYAGIYTLAASIIWGINTLFLLDAGLSISQVFVANAAYSLGTLLFEIPTGVIADTVGRRASFLLSLAVLASTTLLYVWLAAIGAGLIAFAAVSILMGLGFTFYSGAMEAWVVDGTRGLGYKGEFDRVFSRSQFVSGAAMLTGTVGGGLLGQVSLALPYLIRAGLLVILLALAWRGMHDIGFAPRRLPLGHIRVEAMRIARDGVRFGWQRPSLRLLILSAAIQGGFFIWAWYAWQPYFLELLGRDAVWVAGVVAALLAVSMMLGNAIVEIVTRWCGRRTTLLVWSGSIFSLGMVGVGLVNEFWPAVALLFISGVAVGVQTPVRQAFIHKAIPTGQRATVVSFDSMVTGGSGVVGQTGLGALAQGSGYSAGYAVGGLATLAAVPLVILARRLRSAEDFFAGTHPTGLQHCPAPSLPSIAAVDGRAPVEFPAS